MYIKDSLILNVIIPLFIGFIFFQAEDGIRDRSPSRGLGDVYKRQKLFNTHFACQNINVQLD